MARTNFIRSKESKQVKIWRDFCKNKCNNFFNMFNFFFDEIELMGNRKSVIKKYYLDGDVHLMRLEIELLQMKY